MIEEINTSLFHFINQFAGLNPIIDAFAVIIANYMPVVIIICLSYLWFRYDETRDIILYGLYAALIGLLLNYVIGLVYYHPRPFMIPTGTLLFQFPPETSFPSDHTTLMVSLSLMLIYFKETRIIGIVLLIIGFIGGFARVFSGVHFPLDILGSVIVSIIATVLIYYFRDKLKPINNLIKDTCLKLTRLKFKL